MNLLHFSKFNITWGFGGYIMYIQIMNTGQFSLSSHVLSPGRAGREIREALGLV